MKAEGQEHVYGIEGRDRRGSSPRHNIPEMEKRAKEETERKRSESLTMISEVNRA